MRNLHLIALVLLFTAPTLLFSQPCDCVSTGNCPVPIQDNGTFYGTLDVTVGGPNDLFQCPLTQVCFSLTHTWIGDLSISLISPGGLNYLLMADADNYTGGCGNQENNVNVCITTGTGNPLSNNTQYICNTGPCPSGTCCLNNNWTVPCGGVTDPISGALQAPNCNLIAFNQPGHPANGTWTLVVNDVCQQDVGTLDNFSLTFGCGTVSCIVCTADGGALNGPNIAKCLGDPSLNLSLPPVYNGYPPPSGGYEYAYVISKNGVITQVSSNADLTNHPPGTYQVCGFSYLPPPNGSIQSLVGMNLTAAQAQFSSSTAPFCADFSSNCIEVFIAPLIPAGAFDTLVCQGDCIEFGGQVVCNSGPVTFQSWLGCDSVIFVTLTPISPPAGVQTVTVCAGDCITVGNQTFCPPGPHTYTVENWQGCDSSVVLNFEQVQTSAVISPLTPLTLSCSNPAVTLDGTGSEPGVGQGVTYSWSGPGNFTSTSPVISVNTPGIYTLTVFNHTLSPACTSSTSVNVTAGEAGPNLHLASNPVICQGSLFDLQTLNVIDLNNTTPVLTFHTATPATIANQLSNVVVSPTSTTTYYILGQSGDCSSEIPVTVMVNPVPTSTFSVNSPVCMGTATTATYTGNAGPGAVFNWNFDGASALPGQGTGPHAVTWVEGGEKSIILTVTENGCTSLPVSQQVMVASQTPSPDIHCSPATNNILFNCSTVPGVLGYQVEVLSGQTVNILNDTTYQVTGLAPNEQVVLTVEVISGSACPNASSQLGCSAQNCPPASINISPVNPVCLDAAAMPFNLTATLSGGMGGGNLTWSGNGIIDPVTGMFDPHLAGPGVHTISATYQEVNCEYSQVTTINVVALPAADFLAGTPVCENEAAAVTYAGLPEPGMTFAWDFGAGVASPGGNTPGPHAVVWNLEGLHDISLLVTNAAGCKSPVFTKTVEVKKPLEAPVITCTPTTHSIQFEWGGVPGATGTEITVLTGQSGSQPMPNTYLIGNLMPGEEVTLSVDLLGDSACPPVSAVKNCKALECPAVEVNIQPVPPICPGSASPVQLFVEISGSVAAGPGLWSGPGISDPVHGVFDPQMAGIGQHLVTHTFAEANCMYTGSVTVEVLAEPTAEFTVQAILCATDTATVVFTGNAAADAVFNWDFDGGIAVPGIGVGPHQVRWDGPGSYQISLTTLQDGCTSSTFYQNVLVDAALAIPEIECLSTTESVVFTWNQPPGSVVSEVQMLTGPEGEFTSDTSYTVTGLMPGSQVILQLTMNGPAACPPVVAQAMCAAKECPALVVSIPSVAPVCLSDFTEKITLAIDVEGGGMEGSTAWAGNGITDAITGIFDPAAAGVGQHGITCTYSELNCAYEATTLIEVRPSPVADAGAGATLTCQEGQNEAVLGGMNNSTGPGIAYSWHADSGAFPGDSTVLHPVVAVPGTYQLAVTNTAMGCTATDEVVVKTSREVPMPEIVVRPVSCYGKNDGAISIVSVSGGLEPYLFSLNDSPFSGKRSYAPLQPGVYNLAVLDAAGCENRLTFDIRQPQELNVELVVFVEGGSVIHLGDSVQLGALLNVPLDSIDVIDWGPDSLLSCDGCPYPMTRPLQTTTFTVRVERNGCVANDQATVFVRKDRLVYVPNAFSPNYDGVNDLFMVYAGPQVVQVKQFLVFDRWGETVFQYYNFPPNHPAYGWDGSNRGQRFDPGVFTWFAEVETLDGGKEIFKGEVSLMR